MQRLVHEGLVDVRPRSATRVAALDLQRVEEGMLVREALEVKAIEAAARHATPADVQRLSALNDQLERAAQPATRRPTSSMTTASMPTLLQLSGYPRIAVIIDEVNAHLDRVRAMSGALPERLPQSAREHRAILAALARQDADAAGRAMQAHLGAAWAVVRRLVARVKDQQASGPTYAERRRPSAAQGPCRPARLSGRIQGDVRRSLRIVFVPPRLALTRSISAKCVVRRWAWNAASSSYSSYRKKMLGSAGSRQTSNWRQPGSVSREARALSVMAVAKARHVFALDAEFDDHGLHVQPSEHDAASAPDSRRL